MNKFFKYLNYTKSYLKYSDFASIIDSVNFILFGKGARKTRIVQSYLGKVKIRKGTNDFQFVNYYYEWGVKSYLLKNCNRYKNFIDIGAGIGDYAMLMAERGLQVIAFEPIKETYDVFKVNIRLTGLGDEINAYNLAIGKNNSVSDFIVTPVNTGASHRADINLSDAGKAGVYTQKTQIKPLDEIYHEFHFAKEDKLLVKMDMEGMEAEAIEGAKEFIQHFDKITIIAESKHSGGGNIEEALNQIAEFEFGEIDEYNIWARKIRNK